jgi:uncharacterized membrane protein YhaH (DUF805 family)
MTKTESNKGKLVKKYYNLHWYFNLLMIILFFTVVLGGISAGISAYTMSIRIAIVLFSVQLVARIFITVATMFEENKR